ncbi:MAG: hypothetical protein ABJF04_00665 [Reichenbachiella sp.]|uniref:hypothetical protein n=1 Tax=Reichenbachiella sp. TaxID=2184521 RepID=UPI00326406D7
MINKFSLAIFFALISFNALSQTYWDFFDNNGGEKFYEYALKNYHQEKLKGKIKQFISRNGKNGTQYLNVKLDEQGNLVESRNNYIWGKDGSLQSDIHMFYNGRNYEFTKTVDPEDTVKYYYNSFGHQSHIIKRYKDGSQKQVGFFEYDIRGRQTLRKTLGAFTWCKFVYDNDSITWKLQYSAKDSTLLDVWKRVNTNNKGELVTRYKVLSQEVDYKDGITPMWNKYQQINDLGMVIHSKNKDVNEKYSSECFYEFEDSLLIRSTCYRDSVLRSISKRSYNAKKQLISKETELIWKSLNKVYSYKYDSFGNLTREIRKEFDSSGFSNGDEKNIPSYSVEIKYEYEYDEHGNWIRRTEISPIKKNSSKEDYRQITYHD